MIPPKKPHIFYMIEKDLILVYFCRASFQGDNKIP